MRLFLISPLAMLSATPALAHAGSHHHGLFESLQHAFTNADHRGVALALGIGALALLGFAARRARRRMPKSSD